MRNPYNMSNLAQMPQQGQAPSLPQQGASIDPLVVAGYSIIKGTPIGEAMLGAAQMQQAQHQQQLSRFEAERKQREMMQQELMMQNLPEALKGLDVSNPGAAISMLVGKGLDPAQATSIVSNLANHQLQRQQLAQSAIRNQLDSRQEVDKQAFDREEKLRKQHANESSTFDSIATSYSTIKGITDLENPSAADNIALTYAQMKLYDPTSVVREGEYATAKNAGGISERVRSEYNNALDGKFLTPEKIRNIRNSADTIYKSQLKNQKKRDEQFKKLATDYGVNPERSILNFITEEEPGERPVEPPKLTVSMIPTLSSPELDRQIAIEKEKRRAKK